MKPLDLKQLPKTGTSLIEASAGTGKTYSISNLFLHFILKGIPLQEILVVTFTDAATRELRERIRDNIVLAKQVCLKPDEDETIAAILEHYEKSEPLLDRALLNFDQASIFTIHGFCQRMLREHAFESSSLFDLELIEDDQIIQDEIVNDFWRQEIYTLSQEDFQYLNLKREELYQLYKKIEHEPNLEFIDTMDEAGWQQCLKEHEALKQRCNEILGVFEQHKSTIEERLYNGSLSGVSYKRKDFEKKFCELKTCLLYGTKEDTILNYFGYKIDKSVKKGQTAPSHEAFDLCKQLSDSDWPDRSKLFSLYLKYKFRIQFGSRMKEVKEKYQAMTYSDLISNFHDAIHKSEAKDLLIDKIRQKYQSVLVDEFQDTDPMQYQIFQSIFGQSESHYFYMIGDPKQSIYAFRGADIFAYLEAKSKAHHQYTLDTNYRSEKGMVEAVNHFFTRKPGDQSFAFAPTKLREGILFETVFSGAKKRVFHHPEKSRLQLRWFEDPDAEGAYSKSSIKNYFEQEVCREIVELLNLSKESKVYFEPASKGSPAERLVPRDIAILVNQHSQALSFQEALLKLGIPSVIQKSGNVFDSEEAKDLLRFLTAIKKPNHEHILPLWLSSFFDDEAQTIYDERDQRTLELLTELLHYQRYWTKVGVLGTLEKFIVKHQVEARILKRPGGERALVNLYHCRDILHELEMSEGRGLDGLIRFLSQKIHSDSKDDERFLQRLETDANVVQIMTIHKSKGLEFPIVFCPYLWYQSFCEDKSRDADFSFYSNLEQGVNRSFSMDASHPNRAGFRKQWRREQLGEQVRLLYVALTRASNRCYLYWGPIQKNPCVLDYFSNPSSRGEEFLKLEIEEYGFTHGLAKKEWQNELATHPSINFRTFFDDIPREYLSSNLEKIELDEPEGLPFLHHTWRLGSFTSLTKEGGYLSSEIEDYNLQEDDDSISFSIVSEENPDSILSFPRGATVGTAIHEIFEMVDLCEDHHWREVVIKVLEKYALISKNHKLEQDEQRIKVCLSMLEEVSQVKLNALEGNHLCLSRVDPSRVLKEMEFYFTCKNIKLENLKNLFVRYYQDSELHRAFIAQLDHLSYSMQEGFLRGTIDAVVLSEGKYYIIDWKSNYLGPRIEDYQMKSMHEQVCKSFYFLQYHIYALALHQLLKQRLADSYQIKEHFGGVFYLFIRGLRQGQETGCYFDDPPSELIEELEVMMLEDRS